MVEKVIIDYCRIGKSRSFLGKMNGPLVSTHPMTCLGKNRCNSCKYQFCADVTYEDKTIIVEEGTIREFLVDVKRKIGVDLRPYTKGLRD